MFRNLLALAYLVLGAYWAYELHRRLFRAFGRRRGGRLIAYVTAAICYGTGLGAMLALANDGWHRPRGSLHQVHTSVPEGLILGVVLGAILGTAFFVQGERRGGVPFFDEVPGAPEFPASYVREILEVESRVSDAECVRMARYLLRRSRKSGQPLPPELLGFVQRHAAERSAPRAPKQEDYRRTDADPQG